MTVFADMPDDVLVLHHALELCLQQKDEELIIDIGNCGTAMRFLTAYCAQCEGRIVILTGVDRMKKRPIAQLVDILRSIGAKIEYLGEEGFPPLCIKGCKLDKQTQVTLNQPLSSQYISALLMIGAQVMTNAQSPYIDITRAMITQYPDITMEKDWSSAAFWYEYVALYGGEIKLEGLFRNSLQGDKIVADIFAPLGVITTYTSEGIILSHSQSHSIPSTLYQDFSSCPDLYPALALTCERLGITLTATGIESLPWKESDRLQAVRNHRTESDHRMAMALMIAGYDVDDTDCIKKSYPQFMNELCKLR